jgi:Tol biopolymer transport system component
MGAVRPSWSPDYRYIAFIRGGNLTVMEAVGEPDARVFEVCPAWANGHDWAPDSRSIVFGGSSLLGNGLWEVPLDPDTEEVGTPQLVREGNGGEPSWSPDDTQLAFRSDVSGETSLYEITIGDDTVTLLYEGASFANWAP